MRSRKNKKRAYEKKTIEITSVLDDNTSEEALQLQLYSLLLTRQYLMEKISKNVIRYLNFAISEITLYDKVVVPFYLVKSLKENLTFPKFLKIAKLNGYENFIKLAEALSDPSLEQMNRDLILANKQDLNIITNTYRDFIGEPPVDLTHLSLKEAYLKAQELSGTSVRKFIRNQPKIIKLLYKYVPESQMMFVVNSLATGAPFFTNLLLSKPITRFIVSPIIGKVFASPVPTDYAVIENFSSHTLAEQINHHQLNNRSLENGLKNGRYAYLGAVLSVFLIYSYQYYNSSDKNVGNEAYPFLMASTVFFLLADLAWFLIEKNQIKKIDKKLDSIKEAFLTKAPDGVIFKTFIKKNSFFETSLIEIQIITHDNFALTRDEISRIMKSELKKSNIKFVSKKDHNFYIVTNEKLTSKFCERYNHLICNKINKLAKLHEQGAHLRKSLIGLRCESIINEDSLTLSLSMTLDDKNQEIATHAKLKKIFNDAHITVANNKIRIANVHQIDEKQFDILIQDLNHLYNAFTTNNDSSPQSKPVRNKSEIEEAPRIIKIIEEKPSTSDIIVWLHPDARYTAKDIDRIKQDIIDKKAVPEVLAYFSKDSRIGKSDNVYQITGDVPNRFFIWEVPKDKIDDKTAAPFIETGQKAAGASTGAQGSIIRNEILQTPEGKVSIVAKIKKLGILGDARVFSDTKILTADDGRSQLIRYNGYAPTTH